MSASLPYLLSLAILLGVLYCYIQIKRNKRIRPVFLILLGIAIIKGVMVYAQTNNGFDLTDSLIPVEQIHAGGPAKDGIPAIDQPVFISANDAGFLQADDRILGLHIDSIAKAYPIKILNWHEIVNDQYADQPVIVTYCPLCGSGVAYSGLINGNRYDFGVSGLLYNSDVLLYDRQTESLWSQLKNQAISGLMRGTELQPLVLTHTTWQDWKNRHPGTLVLNTETGYQRDYDRDPYAGYKNSRQIFFPVEHTDERFHPKEQILGIALDGHFKAYPFSELAKLQGNLSDTFNGQQLTIKFNKQHQNAAAFADTGKEIPGQITFWFAWYAFHPDTAVFLAEED